MIITSCHQDWQSDKYRTVAISEDAGAKVNYKDEANTALAPKKEMLEHWNRCANIPGHEEENFRFYINCYYNGVLASWDPQQFLCQFNNSVLLCYEQNTEFCHRHIIAAWLEILLNEEVVEAKCNGDEIEYLERPPFYEKIKKELEICMRQKDMHGLRSLRACYLYEQGEKLNIEFQEKLKDSIDFEHSPGTKFLKELAGLDLSYIFSLITSKEAAKLQEEAHLVDQEYCNPEVQIKLHKTTPDFFTKK